MSNDLTTLKNPLLLNYLQGKVETIPLKEFVHLFENPNEEHPFLDTLKDRISLAIMKAARFGKKDFPVAKVERSLFVIFETFEIVNSKDKTVEEKEDAIIKAAASFKYLWMLAESELTQVNKKGP